MKKQGIDIYKEQKDLVLARFKTLNPDSKIMLGSSKSISVKEMISHINKNDEFGRNVIKAQINMLRVLTE